MGGFLNTIIMGAAGCGLAGFIMQFGVKSDIKTLQAKIAEMEAKSVAIHRMITEPAGKTVEEGE